MKLVETSPGKKWDGFLAKGKNSHPFQTTEMASVWREVGFRSRFLSLEKDGVRKAQILMLEKAALESRLVEEISRSWISYSPPVISCGKKEEHEVFSALIEGLKERARSKGVDWITIWGYPLWDPVEWFAENGFEAIERENVLLKFGATAEETMKSFRKDIRRNVKKGLEIGVKVREAGLWGEMLAFHSICSSMMDSIGLKPKPKRFFRAHYQELIAKGKGKLLLAEKDGEMIAGLLVILQGDYAISIINCTKQNAYKYFPQHVLKWRFVEKMPSLGLKYLDLNFAGNIKGSTKDRNIRNFKKGWGKLKKFHEFCCGVNIIDEPITESERELVRKALDSGARSVSEISVYSGVSEEKSMAMLREMWAQGLLPNQLSDSRKISRLLAEGKSVWEIVRETNRPPRQILRFQHYLRNAGCLC